MVAGAMTFHDTWTSVEHRFSLGIESDVGRHYLSIPVSSGIVDYVEFYELTPDSYQHFLTDLAAAVVFADECRQRQHDDLLLQKPGWNRGTPI
jgi:hypothetical protein